MKVVTLIPFWDKYRYENPQLEGLDMMSLGGKALINYPIELSNSVKLISETYIYSNNQNVKSCIDARHRFSLLPRTTLLDSQETSIESIIQRFLKHVDADIIILLHAKSPFVGMTTLSECLDKILNDGYDSAFLARIERKFAWFDERRINYDTKNGTPHLSGIKPVVIETSSMYIFTRESFERTGTRIGESPYIKAVNSFEGLVIAEPNDLKLAEFLLDSQFQIADE